MSLKGHVPSSPPWPHRFTWKVPAFCSGGTPVGPAGPDRGLHRTAAGNASITKQWFGRLCSVSPNDLDTEASLKEGLLFLDSASRRDLKQSSRHKTATVHCALTRASFSFRGVVHVSVPHRLFQVPGQALSAPPAPAAAELMGLSRERLLPGCLGPRPRVRAGL